MNWKDITGHEGRYQVSDSGSVRSVDRVGFNGRQVKGKELVCWPDGGGYLKVTLKGKAVSVHRLVASAFIENVSGKKTVNHKNGIRGDNSTGNLEWATHGENIKHSYSVLGRDHARPTKGKFGIDSKSSKPVIGIPISGGSPLVFGGAHEAARMTGLHRSAISSNANGLVRTHGGYVWSYISREEYAQSKNKGNS